MSVSGPRVFIAAGVEKGIEQFKPAVFQSCIMKQLGFCEDSMEALVSCQLQHNAFYLTAHKNQKNSKTLNTEKDTKLFTLKHPPFCPALHLPDEDLAKISTGVLERGIGVGVVTLLETTEHAVLLTRRAPTMRTFPGVWVPPGGHVEFGETLEKAGLRELYEETGLLLRDDEIESSSILGLWESLFPPLLNFGLPRRHHIVVYRHVKVCLNCENIKDRLKMNPAEVDACVFLSSTVCRFIVQPEESGLSGSLEKVSVLLLHNETGEMYEELTDVKKFTNRIPKAVMEERVTTGTMYALDLWLKTLKQPSEKSQL